MEYVERTALAAKKLQASRSVHKRVFRNHSCIAETLLHVEAKEDSNDKQIQKSKLIFDFSVNSKRVGHLLLLKLPYRKGMSLHQYTRVKNFGKIKIQMHSPPSFCVKRYIVKIVYLHTPTVYDTMILY